MCTYARCKSVDWIYLAQDKVQLLATVETDKAVSVFLKGGKFIDHLSDCHFVKKDSATVN